MIKYIRLFCLLFILLYMKNNCFSQNSFTIYNNITNTEQIKHNFHKNDTLILLNKKSKPISGFSITGNVDLKSKNSLVRVILVSDKNEEYLIYEAYPLITSLGVSYFKNICEETSLMNNVTPSYVKIVIEDAILQISSIETSDLKIDSDKYRNVKQDLSLNQAIEKSKRINQYNAKNDGTWFAGVSNMSLLPYKSKKILFGGDNYNSNGFEYYVSGFFVDNGDSEEDIKSISINNSETSRYPSEFDWRNRHGIDWTTPVKHQDTGGGCWAFAAIGAVEILANLYFNQKLDLDLSEQDLISCSGAGTNRGGWPEPALAYISREGVVNEECFPFANADLECSEKCSTPTERIKIGGYTRVLPRTEDKIKESIIFKGPLTSGYNTVWHHAMVLVGYGTIKEGDYIFKDTENWAESGWANTIQAGNPLIGKTYWIFKNSYGTDFWTNSPGTGYTYMVFKNFNNILSQNTYITSPITSLNYTEEDRICEDKDGDGYFYWGIGEKPNTCPDCAPDEADGDDSDPTLGPMDEYGNCTTITPLDFTESITTSVVWNTDKKMCGDIVIKTGATLTITSNSIVKLQPQKTIIIESGGKLIVSGGKIENANIKAKNGSKLTLLNNGKLYLQEEDNLVIDFGATFDFEQGEIIPGST